ncbi:MAG: NADH-quinone oxidoreductase subunit M [Pirellulaceae bacterium]|nr:NADH-quinone oxidoreductase subunit M [Pirellulaceae bacterium]
MFDGNYVLWLSLIVFLPAAGALVLAFLPRDQHDLLRYFTLAVTGAVLALTVLAFLVPPNPGATEATFFEFNGFREAAAYMQNVFNVAWIPSFDIYYFMGMDGISFPLIMLTALVSFLAMAASWSIKKSVKAYCILFLLLETGMIGVFLALDFFLFYVFWEVMLLPMYFLIGVWGGPRKEYAAIKFFLYTLLGSVLMLIAILMLYFNSDLSKLSNEQLARAHVLDTVVQVDASGDRARILSAPWSQETSPVEIEAAAQQLRRDMQAGTRSVHTFNLLAMAEMGQTTDAFSQSIQWWSFLLLFIGFAIKVPSVPVHTWLPDAHVEAPTPISMILAGVLLKMGGYGIIRICYPICPYGGWDLAWLVCTLGVVSMVYGAFAALAQKDFKRMVAYSSVSHMGYVVLGLGVWSATAPAYDPDYWNMGISGAMFQMIGHGISSAGMFFMVGVIYDRVHHRNLDEFGGLFGKMPVYTALSIGIFFAGLGLPGLCGFIGEVLVVLSVWPYQPVLAIVSASVVVLTAAYILWAIQRVYLGAEYKGPHAEEIVPSTLRENLIAGTLFVLAILLGVFPYQTVLRYMDPTIDRQVRLLADWTERQDQAAAAAPEEAQAATVPAAEAGRDESDERGEAFAATGQPAVGERSAPDLASGSPVRTEPAAALVE